jgi:hypothetical protein
MTLCTEAGIRKQGFVSARTPFIDNITEVLSFQGYG